MRIIFTFSFLLLVSSVVFSADLSSFKESLFKSAPEGYYPKNGEYKIFEGLCNPKTCFYAVSVYYISPSDKGVRRIAVFSEEGVYLGSYSGFSENPVSSNGNTIRFPKSKYGDQIKFDGSIPPESVWIDGETFTFEKAF